MESTISGLQKELSETKEVKSQLEHQMAEWQGELCSLRSSLQKEEEERKETDMLYEDITERLREEEEEHRQDVVLRDQLELTLRILELEVQTVRSKPTQVSDSHEKATNLLHENLMIQDEIATLKREIDTIKNENQEKEKKYLEDIEIVKQKNDELQKAIKLNEEKLTQTYSGQLHDLTAENTRLKSKLKKEEQKKESLETDVELYCSKLTTAMSDHEQSQTAKRDLELTFQRARGEWLCLQDKMNLEMSNLKDHNKLLLQQLSETQRKFSSLDIEMHHTRDALRENSLLLEQVQRELSQAQCQKKESEDPCLCEHGKLKEYMGKQERLEERLAQLESVNLLLQEQLDDAKNKIESKEKMVMDSQERFQDILKTFQDQREKESLMLEESLKKLTNELHLLKERLSQAENVKTQRAKQSTSQETLVKLWENKSVPMKSEMELRPRDLESELSTVKTCTDYDKETELKMYKQLFLEEVKVRMSLDNKLNK
ncbi:ankyrin repeat domain-containing protein 26-like [Sus scrofa]|uniref:ankyrin repeat domain-containing protein 26-like n=1 Tax=Sus scrofa TaxID=9823 RepID=UPI000A2B1555|nr:ankyrin repeat domain-containing protein 26-like [Sus scrofa]